MGPGSHQLISAHISLHFFRGSENTSETTNLFWVWLFLGWHIISLQIYTPPEVQQFAPEKLPFHPIGKADRLPFPSFFRGKLLLNFGNCDHRQPGPTFGCRVMVSMGNPYISPIARGYLWVIPKNPKVEHHKYHGSTRT